jgi:hypothetical protein
MIREARLEKLLSRLRAAERELTAVYAELQAWKENGGRL